MPLSPKTEPVILATAVPTVVSALVGILTVFDVWDPSQEEIAAVTVFLGTFLTLVTPLLRSKVFAPKTVEVLEATNAVQEAVLVDERNQAMAAATEAVRAAETVTATQDAMAKLVAGEVVAKLDEQVGVAPRRARPAEPSDLEHGVYWAPPPPPAEVSVPVPPTVAIHPLVGPVGGRSGPGTEGNV